MKKVLLVIFIFTLVMISDISNGATINKNIEKICINSYTFLIVSHYIEDEKGNISVGVGMTQVFMTVIAKDDKILVVPSRCVPTKNKPKIKKKQYSLNNIKKGVL